MGESSDWVLTPAREPAQWAAAKGQLERVKWAGIWSSRSTECYRQLFSISGAMALSKPVLKWPRRSNVKHDLGLHFSAFVPCLGFVSPISFPCLQISCPRLIFSPSGPFNRERQTSLQSNPHATPFAAPGWRSLPWAWTHHLDPIIESWNH